MTMTWKTLNTLIHISALSIWKYKNPITIVLSSYFHILEVGAWHLLSCICISKNVLKCILKHAIIQYYTMKSKIFLLLIIKVKNIHEFYVLSLSLWILSTQKKVSLIGILYHAFIQHLNLLPLQLEGVGSSSHKHGYYPPWSNTW
jgi:hypothetical protein